MRPLTPNEWREIYLALLPINYPQVLSTLEIRALRMKVLKNQQTAERQEALNAQ